MARSSYIYILSFKGELPVAAFTVKHELMSFLKKNRDWDLWAYTVDRFRDGTEDRTNLGSAHHLLVPQWTDPRTPEEIAEEPDFITWLRK